MTDSSPGLISILRSALERLGDDTTGGSDDPAVIEFKRRILRSVSQLELTRNSLQAPDVLPPRSQPPAIQSPAAASGTPEDPFPAPSNSAPASASQVEPDQRPASPPDSVVVLVARRPRKSRTDDSSGGHSSAA
ncbi:MAG TPA: hypothetical protein VN612_17660 [Acidobacteriaceae bacterium]|nr:hypothetical protein [Acidobacteriaceae bacterium]